MCINTCVCQAVDVWIYYINIRNDLHRSHIFADLNVLTTSDSSIAVFDVHVNHTVECKTQLRSSLLSLHIKTLLMYGEGTPDAQRFVKFR